MKTRIIGIALIVIALGFGAIYGSKYLREYLRQTNEEHRITMELEAKVNADKAREEYLNSSGLTTSIADSGLDNLTIDDNGRIRVVDSDIVAKITIESCKIEALVYENEEDNYYLRRDADGNNSTHGEIYTNCYDCDLPVIYGHHMSDGTMFADLDCAYIGTTITLEDIGYLDDATRTYKVTRIEKDVPGNKVWDLLSEVDKGLVLVTCSYGVKDGRLVIIAEEEL